MGRVRERQERARNRTIQARRRVHERDTKDGLPPAASAGSERDRAAAEWHGEPTLLAFLFSLPDSPTMRALDTSIDYLNQRTGDTWDLFFPGYYRQPSGEPTYEDRPIGGGGISGWLFNALGFDLIRNHIERESRGRFTFSGNTDLVLVGAWLTEEGEPVIDWASTLSGTLTEPDGGIRTMNLGEIVERITNDLQRAGEDPSYGVGAVVNPQTPPSPPGALREFVITASAEIAAALAVRSIGAG
jgi:hypothetical protein